MNKKMIKLIPLLILLCITLSACTKIKDTIEKYEELNATLPTIEINETNYEYLEIDGMSYYITDECIKRYDLNEEIGKIHKKIENVQGRDIGFGYVYSIKDVNPDEKVAVNINNEFHIAVKEELEVK